MLVRRPTHRLVRRVAIVAALLSLGGCGGSKSLDAPPSDKPVYPAAPQINAGNYLTAFGVASVAFARTELLEAAAALAFATDAAGPADYTCPQGGTVSPALVAGERLFRFNACRITLAGSTTPTEFRSGSLSATNWQANTGRFSTEDLSYTLGGSIETVRTSFDIGRDANGTRAIGCVPVTPAATSPDALRCTRPLLVDRKGRSDSYDPFSTRRAAPEQGGRLSLAYLKASTPRFTAQPVEISALADAIVVRAPDRSSLEIRDAASAGKLGYSLRVFRGAGDTAQLDAFLPLGSKDIDDALARALE